MIDYQYFRVFQLKQCNFDKWLIRGCSDHERQIDVLGPITHIYSPIEITIQSVETKIPRPKQTSHCYLLHPRVNLQRPAARRLILTNLVHKSSVKHHHLVFHSITCSFCLRSTEMNPKFRIFSVGHLQTIEMIIGSELMFRCNSVTAPWNDMSIIFYSSHHIGQSIQLSKVLFRYFFKFLLILVNWF